MDLPGYDNWKLATPPEYEREGAIRSAIEDDPELDRLERRAERTAARRDKIGATLKAATGDRLTRATQLYWRLVRLAKHAAQDLQSAIEESADDAYDRYVDQKIDEARGK